MPLRVEDHDRVRLLVLDDPSRRNALSHELVEAIVEACDAAEDDPGVAALVVTGEPPAFCSGADVSSLASMSEGGAAGEADGDRGLRRVYEGFLRVLRSPLPTVAAVNGPAVGAGLNLALACDVRMAAASARFDSRFLSLGLHPGGGHTWLLERVVGPQTAAAMVLFGEALDGRAAERVGLAWRCVADDEVVDQAIALAERATRAPTELAEVAKRTLRAAPWHPSFEAAVDAELEQQLWSSAQGFFAERIARARGRDPR